MRGPALLAMTVLGCGNPEPAPRVATPPKALEAAKPVAVQASTCTNVEWRYALTAGSFEPTQNLTQKQLVEKWRAGAIAAAPETEGVLAKVLGERAAVTKADWMIVPAHELAPDRSVVTVEGKHPLVGDGPLVVEKCAAKPNIDPAKLTVLVMSGTTALTGRTSERIDSHGIANVVEHLKPFFTSADLVHISNEVSFVKRCKPRTGQDTLIFCSRDWYIELLEELNTKIVELTGSHLTDYGERSFVRTIGMYEKRGWTYYGGGRTQIEATAPRFIEHNGNRLAFVGCNAVNEWVRHLSRGAGTAACDRPRMKWQVQDLRRRGYFTIASMQHRELRTHAPPPDLVKDLRDLAEAGASFVLGSQAHTAHPWDVHFGAYVHYGPGNVLFAQHREVQREASVDKLYIYDNKLLTVGHIYVRTEHGQPRPLRDDERTDFLNDLAAAAAAIEPPQPTATVALPPATRERPDSVLVRGRTQYLQVHAPEDFDDKARYPLVVDTDGSKQPSPAAFHVVRLGTPWHTEPATGLEIADFMRAKYPQIDPKQTQITPDPSRAGKDRKRHRRKRR